MNRIILASNSPRRKEILTSLNLNFSIKSPSFDENSVNDDDKFELCRKIAKGKGLSVFNELQNSGFDLAKSEANAVILAADTLVFCEGQKLGKPKDEKQAKTMLELLSGKKHSVVTAIFCMDIVSSKIVEKQAVSSVYFKSMSSKEINFYLKTKEWQGVAGAYKIQERAAFFIEKIEGSYSNIVGLPIFDLYEALAELNFEF